jgi:hypothetical protein
MAKIPSIAAFERFAARAFASFPPALLVAACILASPEASHAQTVDCTALRAKIAALDSQGAARPNRYTAAARKQRSELDRTVAYGHSLGCDQPEIPIFGKPLPANCRGLNARIAQMQANLAQLEAAATPAANPVRQDLVARYDAYCRGSTAGRQAAPQNFFEALFGAFAPPPPAPPPTMPWAPPADESPDVEPDPSPRGGSQAVCVRSCDGGFFPLHVSARGADPSYLSDLCSALCPNTEVAVFTKAPSSDIEKAVSLDDSMAYSELPNAAKFRTSYDGACTCKPPHRSWVEALTGAEQILGEGRKSDIVVTAEDSARLSQAQPERRRKGAAAGADPKSTGRSKADVAGPLDPGPSPQERASAARDAVSRLPRSPEAAKEVVGPDGVKRRVRIIAPTL